MTPPGGSRLRLRLLGVPPRVLSSVAPAFGT
jgi:hypothetical protein